MSTSKSSQSSIAVAIPVYNGDAYLAQAVKSALDQTLAPAEIFITDDACTDKTPGVIASFTSTTAVRSQRLPQRLPAPGAWNAAVRGTSAPYVLVLAHDDLIDPAFIQSAQAVIDAHPEVDLICFGNHDITATGELVNTHHMNARGLAVGTILDTQRFLDVFCSYGQFFLPSAVVMSRRVFDRVNGFDERLQYPYDWDFYLRAAASGAKIMLHDGILCRYRIHATQSAKTYDHKDTPDLPLLFEKMTEMQKMLSEKHCVMLVEGMGDFMRRWVTRLVRDPTVPVENVLQLHDLVATRLQSWSKSPLKQAEYVRSNPRSTKQLIAWKLMGSRFGVGLIRHVLALRKAISR